MLDSGSLADLRAIVGAGALPDAARVPAERLLYEPLREIDGSGKVID
jgi:hypothetical protein